MRFRTGLQTGGVGITPRASPVDTFEMPTAGRQLDQLAQALSQVAPQLGRFSDTLAARADARARAEMEALAAEQFKAGKRTLDEVKRGTIAPAANPMYWGYFEEQFGRLTAADFGAKLREHVGRTVGADASVDSFDAAARQFIDEYEKGIGVPAGSDFFRAGYQGAAAQAVATARMEYAQRAGAQAGETMVRRHQADVRQAILDAKTPDEAKAAVQARLNALAAIMPGRASDAEELTAEAIYEAAATLGNAELARALIEGTKRAGGEGDLRSTKAGGNYYATASQRIAEIRIGRDNAALQEIETRRNTVRQEVGIELATLASSPDFDRMTNAQLEPFIQRLVAAGDVDARSYVYKMRERNIRAEDEDRPTVDRLQLGITDGRTSVADINKALAAKQISTETHSALLGQYTSWQSYLRGQREAGRSEQMARMQLFGSSPFQSALQSVAIRTRPEISVNLGRNLYDNFRASLERDAIQEFLRTGAYPLTEWYNRKVQDYLGQNMTTLRDIDTQLGNAMAGPPTTAQVDAVAGRPARNGAGTAAPEPRPLSDGTITSLARRYMTDRTALDGLTENQQRTVVSRAAQLRAQERGQPRNSTP